MEELRFDSAAVWRGAGVVEQVASEIDGLVRMAATLARELDEPLPDSLRLLAPMPDQHRDLVRDLRRRVTVADHLDERHLVRVQGDVWDLRNRLAHLDDPDDLLSRLPEADRHDSPWAALARMSRTREGRLEHLLAELAALLSRGIGPTTLGDLVGFLARVDLPPVPGMTGFTPVRVLLDNATVEVPDTPANREMRDALLAGVAAAIAAAVQAHGAAEVVDALGAGRTDDAGLLDVLPLLPPGEAAAVLAAVLERGDDLLPIWLRPELLADVLDGVLAARGAVSNPALGALLTTLATAPPADLRPVRERIRAIVRAVLGRIQHLGFLFNPSDPDQQGVLRFDDFRALLGVFDVDEIDELVHHALAAVGGLLGQGLSRDHLRAVGKFLGTLVDTADDRILARLERDEELEAVVKIVVGAIPPTAIGGVAVDVVGEVLGRLHGTDTHRQDGLTHEDRWVHRLDAVLNTTAAVMAEHGVDVHADVDAIMAGLDRTTTEGGD